MPIHIRGVIPHTLDPVPTWHRLGLSCRAEQVLDDGRTVPDLSAGLQAQVADPLWMLARQWQVGEFRGEDAASPVEIQVTTRHATFSSWRAGETELDIALDADKPLEATLEGISPVGLISAFRMKAEAGAALIEMLVASGLGTSVQRLVERFRLEVPETLTQSADGIELRSLARKSCDPRRDFACAKTVCRSRVVSDRRQDLGRMCQTVDAVCSRAT